MSGSLVKPATPGGTPARNPNTPPIPSPQIHLGSLANTALALKQAVDSLTGATGTPSSRAVTFDDLIKLGVAGAAQVASQTAISPGGNSGGSVDINTVGPGITGGPISDTGTLAVEWNAGQVAALGNHLIISGTTLNTTGLLSTAITQINLGPGLFTATGASEITTTGTIYAQWAAGRVNQLGPHLKRTGFTLDATIQPALIPLVTGGNDPETSSPVLIGDPVGQCVMVPSS